MPYCTPEDVRWACGLNQKDALDYDLEYFINMADKAIIGELASRERDQELIESPAGKRNQWYTQRHPIADIDADGVVNTDEVEVYAWTDASDETTKVGKTVSSVNQLTGLIILGEDISSGVAKMTVNYSHYNQEVNFELVKFASAYLAGYLFVRAMLYLIPPIYSLGPMRINFGIPEERLWSEHRRYMHLIRTKPFSKVTHPEVEEQRELPPELTTDHVPGVGEE